MPVLPLSMRLSYGVGQLSDGVKQSAFSTFLFFYYNQVLGLSGTLAGSAAHACRRGALRHCDLFPV